MTNIRKNDKHLKKLQKFKKLANTLKNDKSSKK